MDEYEQDALAENEDDAKRLEKAASLKSAKRKRTTGNQRNSWTRQPKNFEPAAGPARKNAGMPQQTYGQPPRQQIPGPCFHCLEMCHLKATCPKLSKQYPLELKAREPGHCVCDVYKGGKSDLVGNIEQLVKPVDNLKDPNTGMLSTELVKPADTDPTEQATTSKVVNAAAQSLTQGEYSKPEGECSELEPDLSRCWEFEQDSTQISDVQGRMFSCLSFWEQVLEAPPLVLECIKVGYKLPLLSIPEPYQKPNHKSARDEQDFVSQAISELEKNRCVQKSETVPVVCSPLSVVVSSGGKKRFVIDLRYLNGYLLKDSFKYEDLRIAMLMFQKGDYLFSFDLKSGYHHVDIHKHHWQYLGFSWGEGDRLQYYEFKVLPFGLATACYIFTKLLRPLIKHWRGQGLRAIIYLDDGIVAVNGEAAASLLVA